MARGLTRKQKIFTKEYALTGNGKQSAMKAYDTTDDLTARVIASENLTKPNVIKAIKSIADRIPDELLERVHLEGLDAGKHTYKNNNETGEIEDMGVEPDYGVRHKYLDTAYKLKNLYPKEGGGGTAIQINVNTDREKFS
jgi:hypothetical protein